MSSTGRKIFHELKKLNLEVEFISKTQVGEMDFTRQTITVNVTTALAGIVIHEVLHSLYPNKSEGWILAQEEKHLKRMSYTELETLASFVLNRGNWVIKTW